MEPIREREENERNELQAAAHRSQVEKFIGRNHYINEFLAYFKLFYLLATEKGEGSSVASSSNNMYTLSNMSGESAKTLPSFWVPAMTPDSKPVIIPKPDTNIYCPVSGKLLKIKDLIDVKFTLAPNDDEPGKSLISRRVRYMCPVTRGTICGL